MLYAKQIGWLHAKPDENSGTNFELRKKAGIPLGVPDIEHRRDLANMMQAEDGCGWCFADGMGSKQPLSWSEIMQFSAHLGLDDWERGTIRAMSYAYCEGLAIGASKGVAPTGEQADPATKARAIRAVFRMAAPG